MSERQLAVQIRRLRPDAVQHEKTVTVALVVIVPGRDRPTVQPIGKF